MLQLRAKNYRETLIKRIHTTFARFNLHDYISTVTAKIMDQDFPISEVVDVTHMSFDPDAACYSSPCRCGGSYTLTELDIAEGVDVVCCSTCTLCIQVLLHKET